MSQSGVLRTARLEVASRLPEIAPGLRQNPKAVLYALEGVVAANNVAPEEISAADWNKTERHTYGTFGFDQMVRGFVVGEGYDAEFIDPRTRAQKILGNPFTLWGERPGTYRRNLIGMMMARRDIIKHEFTEGSDAEHRWWPYAHARHAILGRRMGEIMTHRKNISDEALSLDWALAGSSLAHFIHQHARFIRNKRGSIEVARRVQAAHDLIHLPLALAGINVLNIRSEHRVSLSALSVKVFWDAQSQKYRIRRLSAKEGDNWQQVFYRGEMLDTSTLKCPMHTGPLDSPEAPTNLTKAGHAATNMAVRYGLFRY